MINALAVLVNSKCGMHCSHCGYALFKKTHDDLSPYEWACVVERACEMLPMLETVAVAGMEPLLPNVWEKTVAVLTTARRYRKRAGLVTNGSHAKEFSLRFPSFRCTYIDLSVDTFHASAWRHGEEMYWKHIEALLGDNILRQHAEQLSVSTVVAKENIRDLPRLLDRLLDIMPEPRLGVLPLRPTQNNPGATPLSDDDVRSLVSTLGRYKERFKSVVVEMLVGSVAGLEELMKEGILPPGSTEHEWGSTQGGVPLFYEWLAGLTGTVARISPNGLVPLDLTTLEAEVNFGAGPLAGNARTDDWRVIEQRLAEKERGLIGATPAICRGTICEKVCYGANERCPVLGSEWNQ